MTKAPRRGRRPIRETETRKVGISALIAGRAETISRSRGQTLGAYLDAVLGPVVAVDWAQTIREANAVLEAQA
jgi:hypothetical protein